MLPTKDSPAESLYAAALWLVEQDRVADAAHMFRMMLLIAPQDERGWLGLGSMHERNDQHHIALELYAMAAKTCAAVRCSLARARLLGRLGRDAEAADALDAANDALERTEDPDAPALVALFRRAS